MLLEKFLTRHNGPRDLETSSMLRAIGVSSIDELIYLTFPDSIRLSADLKLDDGLTEADYLKRIRKIASKNRIYRSYIGLGYYNTYTPSVILRNVLENPSWYTSYTPYQAEISQGRLEALLNYQTMVMDLTGMPIANASLLDEATAASEAMIMMYNARSKAKVKAGANVCFVDEATFPQTIEVLRTKALPLGVELLVGDFRTYVPNESCFGVMVQYPNLHGEVLDYSGFVADAKAADALVCVMADLMALVLLTPPGEWGADVVVGSSQRFGVPMGFGGPHAAFFAAKEEFKRSMPGRIIGVSVDTGGKPALRMSLQTREQHIKREKATSNICTAQALLANMASFYAVYHGAEGLRSIAMKIHRTAGLIAKRIERYGYNQTNENFFDTLLIRIPDNTSTQRIRMLALDKQVNFRYIDVKHIGISIDETTSLKDANQILKILASAVGDTSVKKKELPEHNFLADKFLRTSDFLTLEVFKKYRSETEMMRYIKRLERKDFSLTHSMIALGSCTMKLNAASEMFPITWPEFSNLHPFVPLEQAKGYMQLIKELEDDLCEITGFDAISLQPNSGAQGEYAGLMVIRAYHENRGQGHRNIVLIPASAHGTNPASAVMAGYTVQVVNCDARGNVDMDDLSAKAEKFSDSLAAYMITYPSTHGVFESGITEMIRLVHQHGGQVYMDGANLNAQLGLTSPGAIGADVSHLNLHKTFAIPHGGGGPGVGPIGVARHLTPYLPTHPVVQVGGARGIGSISASPWGSASILPISYGYIKMMGGSGLLRATQIAILNANYLRAQLSKHYSILYTGERGMVAHEMIMDFRPFKASAGIEAIDVAKRLMDYGFHAPTVAFPVAGTLMVEPTESESKQELDRFIEVMIAIRAEIREIEEGRADKHNNLLKNAPHTESLVTADAWERPYTRQQAAFPLTWIRENKFWPSVGRIDDAYGDRNLICSCAPIDAYRNDL
ncbi:MAG: aminomethyl-transferring glycine dehydrogenase [Bacteroidota bacterium]